MLKTLLKCLLVIGCNVVSLPAFATTDHLAQRLLEAYEKGEPMPNLSKEIRSDVASAYRIQNAYVKGRLVKDKIAGFKAGLTTAAAQKQFGISRPIIGVLFKSGDLSQARTISLANFNRLMIETEIGFITKTPILKTVNSIDELKSHIAKIVPVVELPDVGFVNNNKVDAHDLIAANAVSAAYIQLPHTIGLEDNINAIAVSLLHNGVIVNQGQGEDALGDQWEALRWLVNQVLSHGWRIEKDALFITGALGQVIPAKAGVYRAQYNNNMTFEFTCK